ncbi:MAG: hypothetical protein ACREJG_11895 [Candidatus Rokuibacteriota bacterium]
MRNAWLRSLRLHRDGLAETLDHLPGYDEPHGLEDDVHARSVFRSLADPGRLALYSVRGGPAPAALASDPDHHTLIVVREFRRVPLHASALALTVWTARPGCGARLAAALAHFVERAVSLYQPAYVLLAHSLEQPRISALLMGVHECAALQAGSPAAFSVDSLLPEVDVLLATDPEWYAYCRDPELAALPSLVSPYAV